MANTFTFTGNNSAASTAPTGKVNIKSGVTNVINPQAPANQQILVGDPLIANNQTTNNQRAYPAQCFSVVGDTSNAVSNNNLRLSLVANFLGFATTYRSPEHQRRQACRYRRLCDRPDAAAGEHGQQYFVRVQ